LAERLQLPEVFVEALNSKGLILLNKGRLAEARILLSAAVERAHADQTYGSVLRAENNLAVVLETMDRFAEACEVCERAIAFARRRGDRRQESNLRAGTIIEFFFLGRWDEALALFAEEEAEVATDSARGQLLNIALIHCERGTPDRARALFPVSDPLRDSAASQIRAGYAFAEARLLRAEGHPAEALAAAERALAVRVELAMTDTNIKMGLVEAIENALALSDLDKAEDLLGIAESLDPGELTPFLQAHASRLRARLDAACGRGERTDERFRTAAGIFSEFDFIFYLAVTQLEHGEWLEATNRAEEAQPLLAEARETFVRLQAIPWLERADRAASADAVLSA
jgi:tetratricopeptide (TPR) repeat protein